MSITTSYGRVATVNGYRTPYLYGSGYGMDTDLAVLGKNAAKLLDDAFGLAVEIRGNSSGKDVGAHHDGEFGFSLGARRTENETIVFTGGFDARADDADEIVAKVPHCGGYRLTQEDRAFWEKLGETVGKVSCYSPEFDTLEESFAWLEQYGTRFCPAILRVQ
jgi:hypothetical protein